jgi:hypothetical protein
MFSFFDTIVANWVNMPSHGYYRKASDPYFQTHCLPLPRKRPLVVTRRKLQRPTVDPEIGGNVLPRFKHKEKEKKERKGRRRKSVEGIKGYQKAGRSIGRTWQGVKAELRDTFGRKLACYLCVCATCVRAISYSSQGQSPCP